MSDTDVAAGGSFTPAEEQFFASGGESELPTGGQAETGADDQGQQQEQKSDADKTGEGDKTEPKVEKMVSLSALHEERGRRRELDRTNRDLQTQLAELRGKFSIIEKLNAPQQQQEEPLTVEQDVFGAVKRVGETAAQLQKRLDDKEAAEKQQSEQQRAHSKLVSDYRADAAKFEAQNPDFQAAYKHLLDSRFAELQAIGYDDPAALHEALTADEMSIAQSALQRGKSPAEIIYNLAKQRGYKKAETGKDGKTNASDKLDTIERGQGLNKSLASAGGSSGDVEMTGEMLLKMPMEEFEAWCNKNPAKAKKLMGG